ncbi:MAG: ABC transporter permease [Chloroflexi bacterium]|nr:ABC transporter permease [Chloroflexota bacterium]
MIVVAAVAGPVLIGIDPNSIDVTARMQSPSAEHLLGTDSLGRDLLARLLQGARVSLMICLAAVTLATLIGSLIGIVSGYIGGVVDLFAARLIDLFFAIPTLLVAIAVVAALGPSILTTIVAIATAYSPTYARVIRGAVVSVRDRPFVESSRVAGASTSRILRLDIVPAIRPVMIVQSTALVGAALIDEAALGFLGLGVQPPTSSWGSLLSASRDVLLFHPGLALIPGLAVVVTVIASNLIGEGIRAAGDPRLAQRGAEA